MHTFRTSNPLELAQLRAAELETARNLYWLAKSELVRAIERFERATLANESARAAAELAQMARAA